MSNDKFYTIPFKENERGVSDRNSHKNNLKVISIAIILTAHYS